MNSKAKKLFILGRKFAIFSHILFTYLNKELKCDIFVRSPRFRVGMEFKSTVVDTKLL